MYSIVLTLVFTLFLTTPSHAYTVKKITSNLGIPWGITFINADSIFITSKSGKAHLVNLKTGAKSAIRGLPPVSNSGQGGLLDVALLPNSSLKNPTLYFTYSKPMIDGAATTLASAQLSNNQLINWHDLLVTESAASSGRHFGSRIAFDNNGYVFFSVGDRGDRDNGQDLNTHASTIIRLNLDGSVPTDNPFYNSNHALKEIWSYGHRNPQGLFFNNGNLWSIEHGPRGGDEINLIKKGANYGWPVISYGKEYWGPLAVGEGTHKQGMEQPIKYYDPSIAPGSLIKYTGIRFKQWDNVLLAGALKLRHLNVVHLDNNNEAIKEERLLKQLKQRIRALSESPDGFVYFTTDEGDLYRLSP